MFFFFCHVVGFPVCKVNSKIKALLLYRIEIRNDQNMSGFNYEFGFNI